jgi:hypothetical protein
MMTDSKIAVLSTILSAQDNATDRVKELEEDLATGMVQTVELTISKESVDNKPINSVCLVLRSTRVAYVTDTQLRICELD